MKKTSPMTNKSMQPGLIENRNSKQTIHARKERIIADVLEYADLLIQNNLLDVLQKFLERADLFVQCEKEFAGKYHERLLKVWVQLPIEACDLRRKDLIQLLASEGRYSEVLEKFDTLGVADALPDLQSNHAFTVFKAAVAEKHALGLPLVAKDLMARWLHGQMHKIGQPEFVDVALALAESRTLLVEDHGLLCCFCTFFVVCYKALNAEKLLQNLNTDLLRGMLNLMKDELTEGHGLDAVQSVCALLQVDRSVALELFRQTRRTYAEDEESGKDIGNLARENEALELSPEVLHEFHEKIFSADSICAILTELGQREDSLDEKIALYMAALQYCLDDIHALAALCTAEAQMFAKSPPDDLKEHRRLFDMLMSNRAYEDLASIFEVLTRDLPDEAILHYPTEESLKLSEYLQAHSKKLASCFIARKGNTFDTDFLSAAMLYDRAIRLDPDNKVAQEGLLRLGRSDSSILKNSACLALQQTVQQRMGWKSVLTHTSEWVIDSVSSFVSSSVEERVSQVSQALKKENEALSNKLAQKCEELDAVRKQMDSRERAYEKIVCKHKQILQENIAQHEKILTDKLKELDDAKTYFEQSVSKHEKLMESKLKELDDAKEHFNTKASEMAGQSAKRARILQEWTDLEKSF